MAETPIEWFEGMLDASPERADDVRSVRALLELVTRVVRSDGRVELYPVWNGEEAQSPRGTLEWNLESLVAEQFFFNERFMHVVVSHSRRAAAGLGSSGSVP